VPILFNTSFNLAGHAIVETLDNAIWTIHNSEINYLYLPELNILVTK
jgi:carbamoyltransferase